MSSLTAVEIIADVPSMSVDQFVKSVAADRFIKLQDGHTTVRVSFQGEFSPGMYQPTLDISLADAAMPAEEAMTRFRLELFAEEFVQPFCSSLLLGSDNPTRSTLEDHFENLKQLALPARCEFVELDESGHLGGPKQRDFHTFAKDLVWFVSHLITNRVSDQRNEGHLRRLLARLKLG